MLSKLQGIDNLLLQLRLSSQIYKGRPWRPHANLTSSHKWNAPLATRMCKKNGIHLKKNQSLKGVDNHESDSTRLLLRIQLPFGGEPPDAVLTKFSGVWRRIKAISVFYRSMDGVINFARKYLNIRRSRNPTATVHSIKGTKDSLEILDIVEMSAHYFCTMRCY